LSFLVSFTTQPLRKASSVAEGYGGQDGGQASWRVAIGAKRFSMTTMTGGSS